MTNQHCGYIAIVGRPNVGKSTLLNKILGQKISITSRKPQTTRHQIIGIDTDDNVQMIFVDTPGIHKAEGKALNKVMNRNALSVLHGVDIIVFVIDALGWTDGDQLILQNLQHTEAPVVLVINKIDKIKNKDLLLPIIEDLSQKYDFKAIVALSAKTADNIQQLIKTIKANLPEKQHVFAEDELTDRSIRFLTAEIIREKIMRLTGKELPYATAVEIENFEEKPKLTRISAVILVEKPGQKAILLGKDGSKMKQIGKQARLDIEKLVGTKVYLQLWVKIKSGWADDDRALRSLGYSD